MSSTSDYLLGPTTADKWQEALEALPATPDNIPAFFFAHGSPMLAFAEDGSSLSRPDDLLATMGPKGKLASFLGDFGPALLRKYKPKGIVVFSAHWETDGERLGMFIYMLYMIFHTEVYKNNP
jgi:aromatic ring-opening dioxygenase catalytic subunit (LigB family)